MKILFFVPYIPSKIYTRSYNFIKYLHSLGHEITLLALWSRAKDLSQLEEIRPFTSVIHTVQVPTWRSLRNSLISLPSQTPLQAEYTWSPDVTSQISQLFAAGNHFDLVHVEHLRGAKYALYIRTLLLQSKNIQNIPIVWDSVDCISYLFEQASRQSRRLTSRLLTRLDLQRTKKYEGWLIHQFDRVLVSSRVDKNALLNLSPTSIDPDQIQVVQNGVDLSYFAPDPNRSPEPETVVITGKMSYHANVSMVLFLVREIMPHVWAKKPKAKLLVVGKDPAKIVTQLAADKRIVVTGYVEDIRSYLHRATVSVVPLTYGAGIQFKVLEAMACETAVVATSRAIASLNVIPERDILIADTPQDFASQVLRLMDDPILRKSIASAGKTYVTVNHNWSTIAAQLDTIYTDCIGIK